MSIYDEIVHRVNEGRLLWLPCLMDDVVRRVYVSERIRDELLQVPMDDMKWWGYCQHLRVDLDYFTQGRKLTVDFASKREKASQLARLEPADNEIWAIRSRALNPRIRVFGRFAAKDTFIALLWSKRKDSGNSGSKEYRNAARGCKSEWTKLFPAHGPLKGERLDDYVSNAVSA